MKGEVKENEKRENIFFNSGYNREITCLPFHVFLRLLCVAQGQQQKQANSQEMCIITQKIWEDSDTNSDVGFFPTTHYSPTAAGYPTIQFNSDTIYVEIALIPEVKGSILQESVPSPSDANCKYTFLPVLLTYQLIQIGGSKDPFLVFD